MPPVAAPVAAPISGKSSPARAMSRPSKLTRRPIGTRVRKLRAAVSARSSARRRLATGVGDLRLVEGGHLVQQGDAA